MNAKQSKITYHHQGFSLYFRIACTKLESCVILRIEPCSLGSEDLVVPFDMQVWSNQGRIDPKIRQRVRSCHQSDQSENRFNNLNLFLTRRLTARLDARFAHAFEPVKAGRPIISNAVWLSWNCESKTADCLYIDPFEEKIDVESIGKANDWRTLNECKKSFARMSCSHSMCSYNRLPWPRCSKINIQSMCLLRGHGVAQQH